MKLKRPKEERMKAKKAELEEKEKGFEREAELGEDIAEETAAVPDPELWKARGVSAKGLLWLRLRVLSRVQDQGLSSLAIFTLVRTKRCDL